MEFVTQKLSIDMYNTVNGKKHHMTLL